MSSKGTYKINGRLTIHLPRYSGDHMVDFQNLLKDSEDRLPTTSLAMHTEDYVTIEHLHNTGYYFKNSLP